MKPLLFCSFLLLSGTAAAELRAWNFDVTLDGKPIGSHEFQVREDREVTEVVSDARFDVRLLFINAFRYRHRAVEVWNDGCLAEFSTSTRVNRRELAARGTRQGSDLVVDGESGTYRVSDCAMTFAYWNPEFLQQAQLIDPQSGDYLDVQVEQMPPQSIEVRGVSRQAQVYRLTAKGLELTLWYSENAEWLALESVARGGRIIRYSLS